MKNSSTRIIGLLIAIVALQMPGWLFAPPTAQENQLSVAIVRNNPGSVERLLVEGVNPNAEIDGEPLLFFAIRTSNPKIVALLLNAGANPHMKSSKKGESALEFAIDTLDLETYPPPSDPSVIPNLREIVRELQGF